MLYSRVSAVSRVSGNENGLVAVSGWVSGKLATTCSYGLAELAEYTGLAGLAVNNKKEGE